MRRTEPRLPLPALLLLSALSLSSLAQTGQAKPTHFDASGGDFETMYVGELKEKSVVAEIALTELRNSTQWAPTVFVGFRSVDGTTQLRAYLMQYRSEDKTLLAGYSVVESGKPKPVRVLRSDVPLHETIIFRVKRDTSGSVWVQLGDSKPVVIGDGASNLRPFISVSSAKATVSWVAE